MAGDPVKTKPCSGLLWQAEKGAFGPGPYTDPHIPPIAYSAPTAPQSPGLPLSARQQWRFRRESKALSAPSDVLHLGNTDLHFFPRHLSLWHLEPWIFGETCVSLVLVRPTPVSGKASWVEKRRAPRFLFFFFFNAQDDGSQL